MKNLLPLIWFFLFSIMCGITFILVLITFVLSMSYLIQTYGANIVMPAFLGSLVGICIFALKYEDFIWKIERNKILKEEDKEDKKEKEQAHILQHKNINETLNRIADHLENLEILGVNLTSKKKKR